MDSLSPHGSDGAQPLQPPMVQQVNAHDWLRSSIVSSNLGVDAELHQLTSPKTAYQFLDDVLQVTTRVDSSMSELELFGQYVGKSWAGIIRSSGVLP